MSRPPSLQVASVIDPAAEAAARSELRAMGQALGGLRWVQGPGGNGSVKVQNQLWVKASGTRFADMADDGGHARVDLAQARAALDGDPAAEQALFSLAPRPSLETYFHAMGGRVVAHTHALGALLYACSTAPFSAQVEPGVVAIEYVRPGRGVALAIREVLDQTGECVCIMRSHGIVAYADSAARAVALTERFDDAQRRLAERHGPLPEIEPLVASYLDAQESAFEGGVLRALPTRVAPETDPPRYLFPDAPVCASTVLVDSLRDPARVAQAALAQVGRACILVAADGQRVALAKSSSQLTQTCEVAAGHDWLEDALRARGSANYLAADEPARILSMPSEQYRMRLAAQES